MANIDVTELMTDPDFLSAITLIRRTAAVGSDGENTITDSASVTVRMVVQPGAGDMLERLPESVRNKEFISIWYKNQIINGAATAGNYADVLVWGGKRYIVEHVEPFGNWGRGYWAGVAGLEPVSDD